jgi:hypothetical protein
MWRCHSTVQVSVITKIATSSETSSRASVRCGQPAISQPPLGAHPQRTPATVHAPHKRRAV